MFTPKLKFIGGVAILAVAIAGCGRLIDSITSLAGLETESQVEGQADGTAASTLLTDDRNRFQIEVPPGWQDAAGGLHRDAEIQATDQNRGLYVLVLSEDRTQRLELYSLDENASQYRRFIVDDLESVSAPSSTAVTTAGEHTAVQYEIAGTLDGSSVTYLHTTVRTPNRYYQVLAWTDQANYDENRRQLFQGITNSLTELQ